MSVKVSEIKQGLMDTLRQITLLNGFRNDVPFNNVRGFYDGPWIDDKTDTAYPKVMVVLDSGDTQQLVSEQFHRRRNFLVFVFVKKLQVEVDQVNLTESFIEDVEQVIAEHSSLNGTVENASVVSFITDGGVLAPEGCAILRIETMIV